MSVAATIQIRQVPLPVGRPGHPTHRIMGLGQATGDGSSGAAVAQWPLPPSMACRIVSAGGGSSSQLDPLEPSFIWFTGETVGGQDMFVLPNWADIDSDNQTNGGVQLDTMTGVQWPAYVGVPDEKGTEPFVEVGFTNITTIAYKFFFFGLLFDPNDFRQGRGGEVDMDRLSAFFLP